MAARRPLVITAGGVVGTIGLLIVIALCVRLGFWQLARLQERRAVNDNVAARLAAPAVTAASALADTSGLFYRAARLQGTYDNDRSIVLPGRSHRGVPGVYLLTPLRLSGRDDAVLVNRGWVPSPDATTIDIDDFALLDTVSVQGLLLPFPGGAQSLAQREAPDAAEPEFRRAWFTVDEARLRAQYPYPLLPVTFQALPEAGAAAGRARYPTRLDPPALDEGPHLGYALQWFSFALIGIIGWVALVLRGRSPPRSVAPPVTAVAALIAGAAALVTATFLPSAASAQLRPLDPLEWRVFDDRTWLAAGLGMGVLWEQPATLAGTRGTLLEAGAWDITFRSGRMAISLGGTALWRMTDEVEEMPPIGTSRPPDGTARQEVGRAQASTLLRLSPDSWPFDVVVRFGTTLPTSSDESGLERDRTDFFALAGLRYRHDRLTLAAENGVAINGTVVPEYPQSDSWTYSFTAAYRLHGMATAVASVVGQEDGLRHSHIRGNEDLRELRVGLDMGRDRWLRVRYIRGLRDLSPAHGVRVSAGFLLDTDR
ncbi:hypothetical protein BH23GEM9_BH23GEM9_00050 [soil metagenome]